MLKPEVSLMVALATGAVVYGVYSNAFPSVADVRLADQDNQEVASTEKAAAWMSAAVVGGISLIAKDPTVFIIGGAMVVGLSWWYKHSNNVNPEFGMSVPKAEEFDTESMADTEAYANSNGYASF